MTITSPAYRLRLSDGPLGAEVETQDLESLVRDPELVREFRRALDERGVVRIVSSEPVTITAYASLARALGYPEGPYDESRPRIVPGSGFVGDFGAEAQPDDGRPRVPAFIESLHYDTAGSRPAAYSMSHTRDVPPPLAAQAWVDMRAVYASLPARLKEVVETRRALHGLLPAPSAPLEAAPAFDGEKASRRPLLVSHWRTGEPVLYLPKNPSSTIEGLPDEEGRALLAELWALVEGSPARYEAEMRTGDMVVWDNLSTVHTNPPYARDRDRQVWFLVIPGEHALVPHPA